MRCVTLVPKCDASKRCASYGQIPLSKQYRYPRNTARSRRRETLPTGHNDILVLISHIFFRFFYLRDLAMDTMETANSSSLTPELSRLDTSDRPALTVEKESVQPTLGEFLIRFL